MKSERLEDDGLIDIEQARNLPEIAFADSYSRLQAIVDLSEFMLWDEWLQLLGENWVGCDNISINKHVLWDYLQPARTQPAMMTSSEARMLESLPTRIEIFRGCGRNNVRGICWSLDRATAERFPTFLRYRPPSGPLLLATAVVDKADVVALKEERGEAEIITFKPKKIRTIEIPQ